MFNMRNSKKILILFLSVFFILSSGSLSLAEDTSTIEKKGLQKAFGKGSFLENVADKAGFIVEKGDDDRLLSIIGQIINIFLSLLGIVFMILIIIAGYKWMTAAGNDEQVNQAKSYIKYAIIGLFVIAIAWGVWALIRPIIDTF